MDAQDLAVDEALVSATAASATPDLGRGVGDREQRRPVLRRRRPACAACNRLPPAASLRIRAAQPSACMTNDRTGSTRRRPGTTRRARACPPDHAAEPTGEHTAQAYRPRSRGRRVRRMPPPRPHGGCAPCAHRRAVRPRGICTVGQVAARCAQRTPQRPTLRRRINSSVTAAQPSTRWLGVCAQRDAPVVPIGTTGAVRRVNVRGVQDAAGVATAVGLVIVAPPPGLVNVSFRLLRT
jgi:hypothetical protein